MQGSSRAAATQSREAFTAALTAGVDLPRLAGELFSVVTLLDSNSHLRRAVADPAREESDKVALTQRLFAGKVSDAALTVLGGVIGQRWSTDRDLTDSLESYAVETVVAAAESNERVDRVEDELFRFERIVAADPGLSAALGDTAVPADKRLALVDDLLRDKVADETALLVRQAVSAPRGRRFGRVVEGFLDAASRRRDQQTATVTSAVTLTDGDRERLVSGLSALYGGKVHLNTLIDPRVLGGVKVEIGDEVIDGTVIRKLDGARRAMGA
ncbi:ATP synthase F1 subunit delta [Humibacillus sp. DSM 29435]|uniref:F0F1 ATP synthase subunit delta n=1 Tax=Humibacillus sp. DSM 29435 TaxID=1869167 RepID=UPI000871C27E|nr:F0F1 ATP synthase subunit delta [Humibacillus sp. DSM 29435]OFE14647.1 ATP synthase F1 subunit delta [Humibacillus sp. DSM 29435]